MQADFRPPQRRARVHEQYEAPLPVNGSPDTSQFRAQLINQHVLVCDPDHIQRIHSQGYFGKGVMSRARPDHYISDQWEQHEGLFLPVISQSRYDELLRWAGASLSTQGWDELAVNHTLLTVSQPVEMEDVRRDAGGEELGPKGAGLRGSEVDAEAQRSCRLDVNPHHDPDLSSDLNPHYDPDPSSDLNPHYDPDPSSDLNPHYDPDPSSEQSSESDPDPGPGNLVPGPGFVLVVSNSEVCGAIRSVQRTPVSLTEYLQLSPEEAFFLVYSLGCLSVYLQQEPLSIIQLWKKLRSLRPDFISSFAAYQHYRSRGWVPKGGGGAKYGVDFMLYRKGPPFYHASYSVVVERVDDAFGGSGLRRFSWRSLAALNRITANVSKELLLCYVIYPANLPEAELDSPVCLSRLKVQDTPGTPQPDRPPGA